MGRPRQKCGLLHFDYLFSFPLFGQILVLLISPLCPLLQESPQNGSRFQSLGSRFLLAAILVGLKWLVRQQARLMSLILPCAFIWFETTKSGEGVRLRS